MLSVLEVLSNGIYGRIDVIETSVAQTVRKIRCALCC